MIQLLPNLPEHVVGFVASGQVNASDYETVVIPALQSALKAYGRIRILYQLGPDFDGFTSGAMWDDMKVGFSHLKAWERIAVVTDLDWVAGATRIFAFAIPCPAKVFPNNQYDDAVRWIVAGG
ncbi:MAG: STAS/SEC14 domain-containing protein [Betaproteobacteria bacterium]